MSEENNNHGVDFIYTGEESNFFTNPNKVRFCDGVIYDLILDEISDPANHGTCACITCKKFRAIASEPGYADNKRLILWFKTLQFAKHAIALFNYDIDCDCLKENSKKMLEVVILTAGIHFKKKKIITERFEKPIIQKYINNVDGFAERTCPFYIVQVLIDSHYFCTTQSPMVHLFGQLEYEKKMELGIEMVHFYTDYIIYNHIEVYDGLKKCAIETASGQSWFNPSLVPSTLRHYLPGEMQNM